MKTFKTAMLLFAIISLSIALNFTSCQKQTETPNTKTIADGIKTAEHIRDFGQRMQMHRNNPGLKSSIKYEANEAVTELEDLINYDFGYGMLQVDSMQITYSEIYMPLDAILKIADPELSQFYYEEVIEEIQLQFADITYDSLRLLFVDLDYLGNTANDEAIIGISSVVGNKGQINIQTSEDGWRFGYGQGDCLGNPQNGLDAALLLESQLNQQITIVPPPGYVWRYQNVLTVGPIHPTDEGYINSDDNTPSDNYQDYLIFYANSQINIANGLGNILTDDDKCVSTDASVGWNLEMAFYENSYNNIGNNIMIENEGNQWQINVIEYLGGMPGNQNYSAVKHDLSITSSFRYAVPEGDVAIDDIMAYE